MNDLDLIRAVERFQDVTVVCVGDVMLDCFVHGEIQRISPEAPIPVVRVQHQQVMLGGAGNVVRNLAALGARVLFFTVVGDDEAGNTVEGLLKQLPNCTVSLVRDPSRKTTVKTRYIAHNQQVLRVDLETTEPVSDRILEKLLAGFETAAGRCQVVLLSDYAKGVLAGNHVRIFLEIAARAGKPVLVDPKGRDYTRYRGAALVKPNRKELAEATGMPVDDDASVEAAARELKRRATLEAVLVTRGAAGMMLVPENGPVRIFRTAAREVFDVSGAGDTVAATLATGLGLSLPLEDAAMIANLAAGLVVAKAGTAVVTQEQLVHEFETHSLNASDAKVMNLEEAVHRARRWQRMGLKVGFTNGCFDLLHAGHITLLRKARERCDRLIVALNSDASVCKLKGPTRPVQDERTRSLIVSSLACVDLVVVFEEDTPERLIRELRPDVLVKGADYRPDQVVGADLVESWGGELLLVEIVPGHSTTRTMERVAGKSE